MASLIYALNQSLDGYIDHHAFNPPPHLFRHFLEQVRHGAGSIYGRTMYEVMRYWDDDQPGWSADEQEYASVWRAQPKWVVSRTLRSVGPNATLIDSDVESAVRRIKAEVDGEIEVAGPTLAASLDGLIDEFQIYLHPAVTGGGKPYFAKARPPLKLAADEDMGSGVIRLTYVPA